jgi:hypothetical protein
MNVGNKRDGSPPLTVVAVIESYRSRFGDAYRARGQDCLEFVQFIIREILILHSNFGPPPIQSSPQQDFVGVKMRK